MAKRRTGGDSRQALLEAAWELFAERGYANTTVNAVIERAGLSKGTFYHFFDSRQALLDGVVERLTELSLDFTLAAMGHEKRPAGERFDRFLRGAREWRFQHGAIVRETARALYDPANGAVLRRVQARTVELVAPLLEQILAQGAEEGVFQLDHPGETAILILEMGGAFAERQVRALLVSQGDPQQLQSLARRVDGHLAFLERGLGAPAGTISRVGEAFATQLAPLTGEGDDDR